MKLKDALNAFYYSTALCDLKLMNEQLENESITYNTLLYLEIIYSMKGTCTASFLAKSLKISKPGVTLKINEMINQGLVIKKKDEKDGRKQRLYVNEEMVPKYRIYKKQDDLAVKIITDNYSLNDINKFCNMLNIITQINYKDITDLDNEK